MTTPAGPAGRLALVVFVDPVECLWLRPLRRGFRHCFAALQDGAHWLVCDPLKDRIRLTVLELPPGFDLAHYYAAQGHHVLIGHFRESRNRRPLPPVPLTCVNVIKRLLTIDAPMAFTPWQLYRHLLRQRGLWRPVGPNASASNDQKVRLTLDNGRGLGI